MRKKVALTGADGNMGREVLRELAESDLFDIRILLLDGSEHMKFYKSAKKSYGDKVDAVFGNIADEKACQKLVEGADYLVNCAAVIPPHSDKFPVKAVECNLTGAETLLKVLKNMKNPPKLIHISTVALYGNRNYKHPWGRVGDPLLPSVYDIYAATKLKAERMVLESGLKYWAVLRQTAMLHNRMLTDNMSDGLMFHTCFNAPLEWVTARDSGLLIRNILTKDVEGDNETFWKKVYNIGGGKENRKTGYDTFDGGFGIIGGSAEQFMKPGWNTIRNFHGLWFYDGQILEDLFHYQRETVEYYWQEILRKHQYYKLAKVVPPRLIGLVAVQRLLKDDNAPAKWIENGDKGRIKAYFGSEENIKNRPEKWEDFYLIAKGRIADGDIDYENLRDIGKVRENGLLLDHGYDESKPDEELDIADMQKAATFRGGKCLSESMVKGDLYTPLKWECSEGHVFEATPYTVLKAGHWCDECQPGEWNYDALAKKSPFYAQVWYDSHARNENYVYKFDENYRAILMRKEEA